MWTSLRYPFYFFCFDLKTEKKNYSGVVISKYCLFFLVCQVLFCEWEEWDRYTSSFYVLHYVSEVRWISDELPGLLLSPFNSIFGDTANSLYLIAPFTSITSIPYQNRESDLSTWEVLEVHHHHVTTYILNFTSCTAIIFLLSLFSGYRGANLSGYL